MIDSETATLLQDIFRRECRSVLVYVGDAFPWTAARDNGALVKLRGLVGAEQKAINAIAVFLQRRHAPASSHGSYPASFTSINFLALMKILPRLTAFERESIPVLEAELARLGDPAARDLIENLLVVKRKNLNALEEMAAPQPRPAA